MTEIVMGTWKYFERHISESYEALRENELVGLHWAVHTLKKYVRRRNRNVDARIFNLL